MDRDGVLQRWIRKSVARLRRAVAMRVAEISPTVIRTKYVRLLLEAAAPVVATLRIAIAKKYARSLRAVAGLGAVFSLLAIGKRSVKWLPAGGAPVRAAAGGITRRMKTVVPVKVATASLVGTRKTADRQLRAVAMSATRNDY